MSHIDGVPVGVLYRELARQRLEAKQVHAEVGMPPNEIDALLARYPSEVQELATDGDGYSAGAMF